MKWIESVCLVFLTVCAAILLLAMALFVRHAQQKVDEVAGKFEELVEPSQKAIAQVAAAGKTLAQIGAKERNDFDAQQMYYQQLTRDSDALLSSANETVRNVNDVLVPKVSADLDAAGGAVRSGGDHFDLALDSLHRTILDSDPLLISITEDADAARPAIQNFARMTEHGVGISASLEDISARVDKAVGKALAPKNRFLAGLNAMANGSITVAEFVYYVTH